MSTSELETVVSLCFRALDGSNYDVRCAVAELLGNLLATAQNPKALTGWSPAQYPKALTSWSPAQNPRLSQIGHSLMATAQNPKALTGWSLASARGSPVAQGSSGGFSYVDRLLNDEEILRIILAFCTWIDW